MKFFKKNLTSEVAAADVGSKVHDANITTVVATRPPVSADKPVSSIAGAVHFARQFLKWCAGVGIYGEMEWPRLYVHAQDYAAGEGLRVPSQMALAKALAHLRVPKTTRRIGAHEHGLVSYRRSNAERPRVTLYHLANEGDAFLAGGELQLELFPNQIVFD